MLDTFIQRGVRLSGSEHCRQGDVREGRFYLVGYNVKLNIAGGIQGEDHMWHSRLISVRLPSLRLLAGPGRPSAKLARPAAMSRPMGSASGEAPNRERLLGRVRGFFGVVSDDIRQERQRQTSPQTNVPISRLMELARPQTKLIALAGSAQVVTTLSVLAFSRSLGWIVDLFSQPGSNVAAELNQIGFGLLILFTLASIAEGVRNRTMAIVSETIAKDLRNRLFASIMAQETQFFDQRRSGELANRLSADVQLVSRSIGENLTRFVRSSATCAGCFTMMFVLNPNLAVLSCSVVVPVAFLTYGFGQAVRRQTRSLADRLAMANDVAFEKISQIRTVRSFSAEEAEVAEYSRKNQEVYDMTRRTANLEFVYISLTRSMVQAGLVGLLWYGGHQVIDGAVSIGELTSFLTYAVQLGLGCSGLAQCYGNFSRAQGAGTRVIELVDSKPVDRPAFKRLLTLPEGYSPVIEFDKVSFRYPSRREATVLNNLSLRIRPGEIVALAGESGSGKSSILNLILGLYKPNSGQILLAGRNVQDLDLKWLRRQVGIVPQTPAMFNGTIAENVSYGLEAGTFTDSQIQEASVLSTLDEAVKLLPDGYDTRVGERGEALSGGQRQRLALARALIRGPKVLILDEATSALDVQSASDVTDAIENISRTREVSVLLVSHRVSSLRRASRILVLDCGEIVEAGTYEDLVQDGGFFQEMVSASRLRSSRP